MIRKLLRTWKEKRRARKAVLLLLANTIEDEVFKPEGTWCRDEDRLAAGMTVSEQERFREAARQLQAEFIRRVGRRV